MEILIDQEGVRHVARHLMGSRELGIKFNGRIKDAGIFLAKLAGYLEPRVQGIQFEWVRNEVTGISLANLSLWGDEELKAILGIPEGESLGYHGIIEITDELRPKVCRQSRGPEGDDRIEVNVIVGVAPTPTDEYHVYFKKHPEKEGIFIANAFSGTDDGLILPNRSIQTEEEFKKSEEWWCRRAFIKW
jgi:hypothetical protein